MDKLHLKKTMADKLKIKRYQRQPDELTPKHRKIKNINLRYDCDDGNHQ